MQVQNNNRLRHVDAFKFTIPGYDRDGYFIREHTYECKVLRKPHYYVAKLDNGEDAPWFSEPTRPFYMITLYNYDLPALDLSVDQQIHDTYLALWRTVRQSRYSTVKFDEDDPKLWPKTSVNYFLHWAARVMIADHFFRRWGS